MENIQLINTQILRLPHLLPRPPPTPYPLHYITPLWPRSHRLPWNHWQSTFPSSHGDSGGHLICDDDLLKQQNYKIKIVLMLSFLRTITKWWKIQLTHQVVNKLVLFPLGIWVWRGRPKEVIIWVLGCYVTFSGVSKSPMEFSPPGKLNI